MSEDLQMPPDPGIVYSDGWPTKDSDSVDVSDIKRTIISWKKPISFRKIINSVVDYAAKKAIEVVSSTLIRKATKVDIVELEAYTIRMDESLFLGSDLEYYKMKNLPKITD